MTEVEWNTCTDPQPMLAYLRGKASDRKLRLFACACCRSLSRRSLLRDSRSSDAIAACERFADGVSNPDDFERARDEAEKARVSECGIAYEDRFCHAAAASWALVFDHYELAVANVTSAVAYDALGDGTDSGAALEVEERLQSFLLRDIIGNPFRPFAAINRAWRTANVTSLAQAVYNDRAFDRLPILADALEDAGCTDPDILAHCRGPGPHVRGCWVVDLLTGRE